jgi:hypothetical protein
MKAYTKYITLTIACMLIGCATPLDVRSASTANLRARNAEIDHKIAEDDFGGAWGLSRWISHATEKSKTLKDKQEIEAELARRNEASGS